MFASTVDRTFALIKTYDTENIIMKKNKLKLFVLPLFFAAIGVNGFTQCDLGTVSFARSTDQVGSSPDGKTILSAQGNAGHFSSDLNDGDIASFAPVMLTHPGSAGPQITGGAHVTYTITYKTLQEANLYINMSRGSFASSSVFQNVTIKGFNGRDEVFSETVSTIVQTSDSWQTTGNNEKGTFKTPTGEFDKITISATTVSGGSGSGLWLQIFEVERISKSASVLPDGTGLAEACPEMALPINFGTDFSASIKDDQLTVNWSTMTETNSDHFVIEASKNGEHFMELGTVKSNAENGKSSQKIEYTFTQKTSNALALAGYSAFGLGMLLLSFRRKKLMFSAILFCLGTGLFFTSCSKDDTVDQTNLLTKKDSFIRIKQVDKDGSFDYSPTFKVSYLE